LTVETMLFSFHLPGTRIGAGVPGRLLTELVLAYRELTAASNEFKRHKVTTEHC